MQNLGALLFLFLFMLGRGTARRLPVRARLWKHIRSLGWVFPMLWLYSSTTVCSLADWYMLSISSAVSAMPAMSLRKGLPSRTQR